MKKEIEKQAIQKEVIGYICDVCGIESPIKEKEWLDCNYNHSAWGNDSIDSYKYYDFCSPVCFAKKVDEISQTSDGEQEGAEIADMPFKFAKRMADIILKSI